jgi:hypothetical protein
MSGSFGLLCGVGVAASMLVAPSWTQGEVGLPIGQNPTAALLEFDTGACGQVNRVETRSSPINAVPAADSDDEDDDWVNAWDMSPEQSRVLNDWLAQHPEIQTFTNAVEKSCDDQSEPIGDFDASNIA